MTNINNLLGRFSTCFELLPKDITFIFDSKCHLRSKRKESTLKTEIKANKFLLSLASPVFDAMFNGPLKETKNRIYVSDLKESAFETLLE